MLTNGRKPASFRKRTLMRCPLLIFIPRRPWFRGRNSTIVGTSQFLALITPWTARDAAHRSIALARFLSSGSFEALDSSVHFAKPHLPSVVITPASFPPAAASFLFGPDDPRHSPTPLRTIFL